jgi:hypothetical protein
MTSYLLLESTETVTVGSVPVWAGPAARKAATIEVHTGMRHSGEEVL